MTIKGMNLLEHVTLFELLLIEKASDTFVPSGRVRATAGINVGRPQNKNAAESGDSLKMAPDSKSGRTISIILPNLIHGSKKKNL